MNTNRATAYSPEAIANREAEGMVICPDCLLEMYDHDLDAHKSQPFGRLGCCLGRVEYAANYAAAPDPGDWNETTAEELIAIQRDLDNIDPATLGASDSVARHNWRADRDGATWAIGQIDAGRAILLAQDEDGYYFAARFVA